ncbi:MAG: serine/threonine protein kinase [Polyangiaceae bacterium]|nr:serine/threonine protein kinase [Polyangiaceae bacterium]
MNGPHEPRRPRQPGDVLADRFRLEAPLGRGGYGEVWRARELLPDGSEVRQVALKLLAPELASADWAREARILASLRHPALVTIFSAGLLPLASAQPFLAMELLVGTPLSRLLQERGPLRWRRALAHACEVADALDAIHQQGIVHLDLKPANLLLDEGGRVRLLDFGIAHHGGAPAPAPPASDLDTAALLELDAGTTSPGSVADLPLIGTPGFLAPELLERRAWTPAADAYALGATLAQLLSGRLPQRVPPPPASTEDLPAWRARVWASTLAGDLLPLEELAPAAPRAVQRLLHELLALDPSRRPPPGGLHRACREAFLRPFGIPELPYIGLQAYGREAEGLLFGREEDSERLSRELTERPALVLQGASGSGKSSLAVAGVVPALARSFAEGKDDWVAVTVRPGHDLSDALEQARKAQGERVGLVLVVDQLEELVTQLSAEERARFVLSLAHLTGSDGGGAPSPGLRVLCTLREDFTTRVAAHGPLGELLARSVRFVAPPSAAAGRAIVAEPARLAGVEIEDEGPVVDEVLRELRADEVRLPLVSFALSEWWSTRRGGRLSAADWRAIGGVGGALSRHADATLDALPPEARGAARDLCLRLVHFGPQLARERAPEPEIRGVSPALASALDAFLQARLVVLDEDRVTFSHEALLREWSTLAGWIHEERAQRSEAASLAPAARRWREAPAPARLDRLLQGVDLARALELGRARPDLVAPFADFLEASRRRGRRARVAKLSFALLLFSLTSAALLGYGLRVRQHSRELQLREDDVARLGAFLKDERRKLGELQGSLERREQELAQQKREGRRCQEELVRVEQEHRAALAARHPGDSHEHRVTSVLLQLEHVWNLHDTARIGTFLAEDVDWQGLGTSREQVQDALAEQWSKSPHARWLIGEVTVRKEEETTEVRLTREERARGRQEIAVLRMRLRGSRPERLLIEQVSTEKVIVASRPLGCP